MMELFAIFSIWLKRQFTHRKVTYPVILNVGGKSTLHTRFLPKPIAARIRALVDQGYFALPLTPHPNDIVFACPGTFDGLNTLLDVLYRPSFGWKTETIHCLDLSRIQL